MNIKKIFRNKDIIYKNEDLEILYNFKNFPVFMGCTEQPIENDILFDMQWAISKKSGIIQLNPLLPLEILYPESHGSGNIGSLWLEHHQNFAKFIQKHQPKSILEIGGLHGILNREYKNKESLKWTIIEPNPSPVEGVTAKFIKGFFDEKFNFDGEVDTIVHSHVFEHIYNPNDFISQISNFLDEGQKLLFSIPNLEEMLKRKYTNCLNFEHTLLLSEAYISFLLTKFGFRQIDKVYFHEDHSIFYAFIKDSRVNLSEIPSGLYENNKKLFLDFIEYHRSLINNLNLKINNTKKEKPIYMFGAHIFSQYLIECGIDINRIICLLDNDPNKQGKRLYGSEINVESPQVLKGIDSPIVILKSGVYNQEIKKDIIENINPNTVFWE